MYLSLPELLCFVLGCFCITIADASVRNMTRVLVPNSVVLISGVIAILLVHVVLPVATRFFPSFHASGQHYGFDILWCFVDIVKTRYTWCVFGDIYTPFFSRLPNIRTTCPPNTDHWPPHLRWKTRRVSFVTFFICWPRLIDSGMCKCGVHARHPPKTIIFVRASTPKSDFLPAKLI